MSRRTPTAALLYEESGGNPFYLEQLARASDGATRVALGPQSSVAELRVPAHGRRRPGRGARAAVGRQPAGAARARRSPATRSSPSWPPPRPDVAEPETMEAIDELLERELDPADHRAAALPLPPSRSCGGPSTRPRRPPGGSARTNASPQPSLDRGAGALSRAHHVDASARVGDAAAVMTLAEAGRQSAQRAPATAARWFSGALRLLPDDRARLRSASTCCSAAATALAATGRFADAHEALAREPCGSSTATRRSCACGWPPPARGSSICSAATTKAHDRLAAALARPARRRRAGRRLADARTRRRRVYRLALRGRAGRGPDRPSTPPRASAIRPCRPPRWRRLPARSPGAGEPVRGEQSAPRRPRSSTR